MRLSGIPHQLWPVHLRPYEDELLSSWIVRLSHANGYRVESFCTQLLGARSAVWNRDIDRSATQEFLNLLSLSSGCDLELLRRASLTSLQGRLTQKITVDGNSPGLVPLRIYHRRRKGAGLMFCPECFKDKQVPYWRKLWRVSYLTACPLHGCELHDVCPACFCELAPHRVDIRWDSGGALGLGRLTARCHGCFHDLTSCASTTAGHGQIAVAGYVTEALANGWTQIISSSGQQVIYGLSFISGIRSLIRMVRCLSSGELAQTLGVDHREAATRSIGFDHDPLCVRRVQIESVGRLLHDWPERFVQVARNHRITYSSLISDRTQMPYWVEVVAREHLFKSFGMVCAAQVNAIALATDTRRLRFSVAAAKKLSGVSLDAHKFDRIWVHQVDRDTCSTFVDEMDHLASQIWEKKARMSVIADKVMFAFAWYFGLTQPELSRMRADEFVKGLLPSGSTLLKPMFSIFPESKGQMLAWVEWYRQKVRPVLEPLEQEESLFVSHVSRRALSASAIGERFRRYRILTGMHRQIPDYTSFVRSGQMSFDSMRRTRS